MDDVERGRRRWKRHLGGSGSPCVKKREQSREENGVVHDSNSHRHRFLIPAAATAPSIPPLSSIRCASSAACMREGRDEEGEGGARTGLLRGRRPPSTPSPSSSLSPPVIVGEKNMRKDKKSEITKAIRDRLSFSSSGARPSCWGSIGTGHRFGRSRRGTTGDEHGTPLTVTATIRSIPSCVCINDNPCGCRSTSNGKADSAGVRSLVERNDFYCQDCNTHK